MKKIFHANDKKKERKKAEIVILYRYYRLSQKLSLEVKKRHLE